MLLGCTGSVAAIKLQEILQLLQDSELFEVKVVLTRAVKQIGDIE